MGDPHKNDHMVDELTTLTQKFSFADNRLSLPAPVTDSEVDGLSLIGKIISSRSFSTVVIKDIIQRAWNSSREVTITKMGKNIFLFSFGTVTELENIFQRRPWTLRGAHLVLKKWSPDLLWQEVDFSRSTFWVQIHGLPGLWQKPEHLRCIGSEVGEVLASESDIGVSLPWKKFYRLRIDVDISKPLKPGVFLPRNGRDDLWIALKYEKLPDSCFNCGCIGHITKDCNSPLVSLSNQYGVRFQAYGGWLSADNDLFPPGVYEKVCGEPLMVPALDLVTGVARSSPENPPLVSASVPIEKLSDKNAACLGSSGGLLAGTIYNLAPLENKIVQRQRPEVSSPVPTAPVLVENVCCPQPHARSKLSRSGILNLRIPNTCQHSKCNSCPIIEAIYHNFGPTSRIFEPNRGLPISAHKVHPTPGLIAPLDNSELIDIQIVQSFYSSPSNEPSTPTQQLQSPEISLISLKRKSPNPLPGEPPKKGKFTNDASDPQSPFSASFDTTNLHGYVVESNAATDTHPFCSQLFSLAEEAGLIKPPPSP